MHPFFTEQLARERHSTLLRERRATRGAVRQRTRSPGPVRWPAWVGEHTGRLLVRVGAGLLAPAARRGKLEVPLPHRGLIAEVRTACLKPQVR